jgi:tetratricopeptide (TPR) repeat protein
MIQRILYVSGLGGIADALQVKSPDPELWDFGKQASEHLNKISTNEFSLLNPEDKTAAEAAVESVLESARPTDIIPGIFYGWEEVRSRLLNAGGSAAKADLLGEHAQEYFNALIEKTCQFMVQRYESQGLFDLVSLAGFREILPTLIETRAIVRLIEERIQQTSTHYQKDPLSPDMVGVPGKTLSNLPRSPNGIFVGRRAQLDQVAARFRVEASDHSGRVAGQVIVGSAGVGKTELALRYADSQHGTGLVWWIPSESGDQIEEALAELAIRLQPSMALVWTAPAAVSWATQWLETHGDWLVILDNVEDPALVEPLLGRLHSGQILVTTRRELSWRRWGLRELFLTPLDDEASLELLFELIHFSTQKSPLDETYNAAHVKFPERDEALRLAQALGGLPQAIQQAGAYIGQQRITIAAYLQRLAESGSAILRTVAAGDDPRRAVGRAWDITLTALAEQEHVIELLHAIGWLASDNIPRLAITFPADAHIGPNSADEFLGIAASYSLITLTQGTVSMHRLLQTVLRDRALEESESDTLSGGTILRLVHGQETALDWLSASVPINPKQNMSQWGLWRALLPHVIELTSSIPMSFASESLAHLLAETGSYLLVQGRYSDAETFKKRALDVTEAVWGKEHRKTAMRLDNLASVIHELGRYEEALPLRQRALSMMQEMVGPTHPDTAIRVNNLARTLQAMGRYSDALPLRLRALQITEAAVGPHHAVTARRLDNLAYTLHALGRYREALDLEFRAVAMTKAASGSDHHTVCLRLDSLGITLHALGEYEQALSIQQQSVRLAELAFGPEHPDHGKRLDNLAATYDALGRKREALALRERALAISEAKLGSNHPETAARMEHLGISFQAAGRIQDAAKLCRKALAITESTLGPHHPETSSRLRSLGTILAADGSPAAALALQQRALRIARAALGLDHPETAKCMHQLSLTLFALGYRDEAIQMSEEAVKVIEELLGSDHPEAKAIKQATDNLY